MIRFAVVGTNWITNSLSMPPMKLASINSPQFTRSLEQAQAFASDYYPVDQLFTSLDDLAQSDAIDAVYIASPNSCTSRKRSCSWSHKST